VSIPTTDDILAAIREASQAAPDPEGAKTMREWAEVLGVCVNTAQDRLRPLVLSGRMEAVKVQRLQISGETRRVSAYRLVQRAKVKR